MDTRSYVRQIYTEDSPAMPGAQKINASQASGPTQQSNRRFFGIPKRSAAAFPSTDNYELKYPEDAHGEEMGVTARVWRTYLDEAHKADTELVEGWRDTTDVLLVFAGLFSAVVATFVVQTSTNLQPNYSQITASLLVEQNALLRATANHTSLDNIPPSALSPDSDFPIANHDRWVNGLWFTSLSVSLVAAFMAVLVKQWIQHYVSVVSGTPHDQVRIRQFRFLGVQRWHMPLIIGTLPILLHLALLLYFAGLVLFLWPLDASIAYTTLVIAILAYGFYAVSNVLPLWYPICPYKTPLSSLLAAFTSSLHTFLSIFVSTLRLYYSILIRRLRAIFHAEPLDDISHINNVKAKSLFPGRQALYQMKESEKKAASKQGDEVDAEALVWLYSTSSNPTVASITVQAIAGLRLGFLKPAREILKKVIFFKKGSVEDVLLRKLDYDDQHSRRADDTTKVERLLRVCHQLGVKFGYVSWWNTRNIIANTTAPALQILHACHSMLYDHAVHLRQEGEAPLATLESYDYTNEGPTPFMWSVLLKRCRSEKVDDPLRRWLHGIRVMHRFPSSYDSSNTLRRDMLLEYFCSLSRGSGNNTEWGKYSVLAEVSPFCVEKVLPQIYSALSEALRVVCVPRTPETELASDDSEIQLALPPILERNLRILANTLEANMDPVDQEAITKAASTLRLEVQKLAESESFWNEKSSEQRAELCELLTVPRYWPSWMPPWKILWTPGFMDYFLHSYSCFHHWADSSFSEGNPHVYQLFEDGNGLTKVNMHMHGLWFKNCYLEGLIRWKADASDRERHINYLFAPINFACTVQKFVLEKQADGIYEAMDPYPSLRLVGQLFKLRSPDQYPDIYGELLDALLELVKDHPVLWPLQSETAGVEALNSDLMKLPRWKQFFGTGKGTLLRRISRRVKAGNEPGRGPEAA